MFKKFCSVAIALVMSLTLVSFQVWASSAESNAHGSSLQLNEIDSSNYYDVVNVAVQCSYNDELVDVFSNDPRIVICNATGETLSQRPDFDSNAYYLWELVGSTATPAKDVKQSGSFNEVSGTYMLSAENTSAVYFSETGDGNYTAAVYFDLIFIPNIALGKEVFWTPNVTIDETIDCAPISWSVSVFKQGSAVPLTPDENGAYSLTTGVLYSYTISNLFANEQMSAKYADIHRSFIATEDMSNDIVLTGKHLNEDTLGFAVHLVVFDRNNPRVELDCDILATNQNGDTITLRSSVNHSLSGFLPPDSFALEAVLNGVKNPDLCISYSLNI